jgi:peptidyl-prolyl cis-trans isomerase B (cyclophilin B)
MGCVAEVWVVSNKQRRRQLARAKWERQQERRAAVAQRNRRVSTVVGIVVGLIAVAAMIWVVLWLVDQENDPNPQPAVPTDSDFPSFISPPATTPATETSPDASPTSPVGGTPTTEQGTAATQSPTQGGS